MSEADPLRMALIKSAILPYMRVANLNAQDLISAACIAVPGAQPEEVAVAFEELARDITDEASE